MRVTLLVRRLGEGKTVGIDIADHSLVFLYLSIVSEIYLDTLGRAHWSRSPS